MTFATKAAMLLLTRRVARSRTAYALCSWAARAVCAAAFTLPMTGCYVPIAVPVALPSKIEVTEGRRAVPAADGRSVTRVSTGVHLASALRPDAAIGDVGLGYVLTDVGAGAHVFHGVYAETSLLPPLLVDKTGAMRLLLSLRGEALFPDAASAGIGLGVFGRVGLLAIGKAGPRADNYFGVFTGSGGAGYFVEVGEQQLPGGARATVGSLGLSIRFPATAGAFFYGWARIQ